MTENKPRLRYKEQSVNRGKNPLIYEDQCVNKAKEPVLSTKTRLLTEKAIRLP
jgi:hypothetical protein